MLFRAFFAILLAHLLTDFIFQSRRLVERKRSGKASGYALHGLIHYVTAIVLVAFFIRASSFSVRTYAMLLALTVIHVLIDLAKTRLTVTGILPDGSLAYVADQLIHLLTIALAAWLLFPGVALAQLFAPVANLRNMQTKWLSVPVIYIAVIFGGGFLIRYLTRTLAESIRQHSPEKSGDQLQNAGLYIGWLERFLVITALLLQSPATIGLILTAKSIARYPEFKSEHFAEYFLIGTLLSISIAIVGGALLAKILFGAVRFS